MQICIQLRIVENLDCSVWRMECDVRTERAKYEILNAEYGMRNAEYRKRRKNMECGVSGVACNMHCTVFRAEYRMRPCSPIKWKIRSLFKITASWFQKNE